MNELSDNARFKPINGLEVTEVPDGFVIYDEPRDLVHYLNPTAAVAYLISDGSRTVGEIRAFLVDVYDVEQVPDLAELFTTLEQVGLMCRVP